MEAIYILCYRYASHIMNETCKILITICTYNGKWASASELCETDCCTEYSFTGNCMHTFFCLRK